MTGKILDERYELIEKSVQAVWLMCTKPKISFLTGLWQSKFCTAALQKTMIYRAVPP